ncbi:MAG: rhodanese-like domain-containing protein [Pyrinomonadaceae bacterium]
MAQELRQAGYKTARALEGGWKAWQETGLPVEPRSTYVGSRPK